jgi:hypothetical protein
MIKKKHDTNLIKISNDEIKDILNIVFCISAKDGILSDIEIQSSQLEFTKFFNRRLTSKALDLILDDFFNSDDQIESYMDAITNYKLRLPILKLAFLSASADGLDIKENIAFQKAINIWKIDFRDVIND